MYCSECRFFSDLGRCRNGATRRNDVGYFQKACDKMEPREQKAPQIEQETPQIEHTMDKIEQKPKTKVCTKCGRELPLDAFGKKTKAKDGHQTWCKECQSASALASRKTKKGKGKPAADVPNTTSFLEDLSDEDLMNELMRRGWKGTLHLTKEAQL